ncbi:MAG: hypothetical protein ACRCWQ_14425, partial [Bacilli bacterium]
LDGNQMPLKEVIDHVVGSSRMTSIIYCPNKKVAFFQGEQSYGPPKRYILKVDFKNNHFD